MEPLTHELTHSQKSTGSDFDLAPSGYDDKLVQFLPDELKNLQVQLRATSAKIIQLVHHLMESKPTRQKLTGLLNDASDAETNSQFQLKAEIENSKRLRERIQIVRQSQENGANSLSQNLMCAEMTGSNVMNVDAFLEQFDEVKMTEEVHVIAVKLSSDFLEEDNDSLLQKEVLTQQVTSQVDGDKRQKCTVPITTFRPIMPFPVKCEPTYVLNVIRKTEPSSTMLIINPLHGPFSVVCENEPDYSAATTSTTRTFAMLPVINIANSTGEIVSENKKSWCRLGQSSYMCEICGANGFTRFREVQTHLREEHHNKSNNTCLTCGKSFSTRFVLKSHMSLHSGTKPYICGVCEKSFPTSGHLQQHMYYSHEDNKRYKCAYCDEQFKHHNQRRIHMKTHTGDSPEYTCLVCRYQSDNRANLTKHMRLHTGEKSLLCSQCGRSFSDPSGYKRHMLIHSGVRPYSCVTCGKTFHLKYQVRVHARSHVGDKRYVCMMCGQRYMYKKGLRYHMEKHGNHSNLGRV